MSLNKVRQVKSDKGFRIADLIVYGIIALIITAIFIAVFFTRDQSPLKGIQVYCKGEAVFLYDFGTGEYEILNNEITAEVTSTEEGVIFKIITDEGYNTVSISTSGSVKMIDADCKNKDCVYSPAITDNSGIIFCSPHGVRIVPYNYENDDPNVDI